MEALRRDRQPGGLDADLAANRSFSLSAKVRIQKERDLKKAINDTVSRQKTIIASAAFKKMTGFDFWW